MHYNYYSYEEIILTIIAFSDFSLVKRSEYIARLIVQCNPDRKKREYNDTKIASFLDMIYNIRIFVQRANLYKIVWSNFRICISRVQLYQ